MRDPFPFIARERRGADRRQSPVGALKALRAIGKILLIGLLAFAGWKWRYVVYTPLWAARALRADKADIYLGKTNDIPNLRLTQQARGYLTDTGQVDNSGNFTSPEMLRTRGVHVESSWFKRHHPDSVDFNPFTPDHQGNFVVTWNYVPGCQKVIWKAPRTDADWYDLQGQPCFPVCTISVLMDRNLKLTDIKLKPAQYP